MNEINEEINELIDDICGEKKKKKESFGKVPISLADFAEKILKWDQEKSTKLYDYQRKFLDSLDERKPRWRERIIHVTCRCGTDHHVYVIEKEDLDYRYRWDSPNTYEFDAKRIQMASFHCLNCSERWNVSGSEIKIMEIRRVLPGGRN